MGTMSFEDMVRQAEKGKPGFLVAYSRTLKKAADAQEKWIVEAKRAMQVDLEERKGLRDKVARLARSKEAEQEVKELKKALADAQTDARKARQLADALGEAARQHGVPGLPELIRRFSGVTEGQ